MIHALPAALISPVQNVESLCETSSTSHLEYFLMSHDRARSAAEPFNDTTENTTKTQECVLVTHVLNLGPLQTFSNEISGTPRVQPKLHTV